MVIFVQSDLFIAHAVTFVHAVRFEVKTTFPVTSIRSPWRAGAVNSRVSIEIVTNSRCANLEQVIPAALSMRESNAPPNRVLYEFVSCGKTSLMSVRGSVSKGSIKHRGLGAPPSTHVPLHG